MKASENQVPSVTLEEVASDGSDLTNPAADHRRLFLGEDGALHLRDSAGTVTDVSSGSTGAAISIVGYNTAGASYEGMIDDRYYCKKVTLAATSLVVSVSAYIKGNSQGGVVSFGAAVMADSSGPTLL